jgi:hypothetical protein
MGVEILTERQKQSLRAEEAEDLPHMITPIPEGVWKGFFVAEAKKLKTEILGN